MLKKIIAAAICGIVISSMAGQAKAAGPGGFARNFDAAGHAALAQMAASGEGSYGCVLVSGACATKAQYAAAKLTDARRGELSRINATVNQSMDALDGFLSSFDDTADASATAECFDCASIKRRELLSMG